MANYRTKIVSHGRLPGGIEHTKLIYVAVCPLCNREVEIDPKTMTYTYHDINAMCRELCANSKKDVQ